MVNLKDFYEHQPLLKQDQDQGPMIEKGPKAKYEQGRQNVRHRVCLRAKPAKNIWREFAFEQPVALVRVEPTCWSCFKELTHENTLKIL